MADITGRSKKAASDRLTLLLDHYSKGTQDMDIRRTRKNGWNEIINAYMGKLPSNWPFLSVVTDPRIRTTILEKTARLLNAKLQGRLVPREGGDIIKARINNAILDFQWDYANEGGSMLEKVARTDQITRLFGAAFVLVYWDNKKNSNEIKVIDPRDIWVDWNADHVRNSQWVQIREWTTPDALEARGFDAKSLRKIIKEGASDRKDSTYESQVLANRGLDQRIGNDLSNPVVEIVTEWTETGCYIFAPKHEVCIYDGPNPYKHGKIPVTMLRYYPIPDDIFGESEVESVMPIQKAINAFLCGTIDELSLAMRPPVKVVSGGSTRLDTIEYGPGAKWIVDNPNSVTEHVMGVNTMNNFQGIYSTLVAAFETAMGGQSLGVSNIGPLQKSKTATEVVSLEKQQTSRDQYNQLYLSEFLKDIMLMWLANNQQYLFDDPTRKYLVYKIIGKDNIKDFQSMDLADKEVPKAALDEIAQTVAANPDAVDEEMLNQLISDVAIPKHPVILNPNESDPAQYQVKPKLDVKDNGEAELYVTAEDMEGVYDYVPDVKSMATGAGVMMQQARSNFMDRILNPAVQQLLITQGDSVNIKELLIGDAENAGYKDAESLFQPANARGNQAPGASQLPNGALGVQGLPGVSQTLPSPTFPGGMAGPQGLPNPGEVNPGLQ